MIHVPHAGRAETRDHRVGGFPSFRCAGRIIGDVMTLYVTRTDTAMSIGAYSLQRGVQAQVFKCAAAG